jgi:hypothetical protein
MKTRSPIVLACIVLLSGCSTLSEKECRTADWHQLGVRDGQQGKPASLLSDHQESCTKYGINPNEGQYLAGREAGLRQYCRLDNAFRIGMNGEEYGGVCPTDVDMAFRRNNAAALEVYNSKKKIEDIDRQLSKKEHELSEKETSDKEKRRLREEIRDLDRSRERARSDLYYQERTLDRLMDESRYRDESR